MTGLVPFPVTETTLDNGLRVVVVPTGFPHLVSLQIPVQTGSRNEVEPGLSGFAHFFEHMMFRGTERFSPEAYQRILTLAGARQNAYTSDDYTNYHTTFAREDLERILEIEADRFQHLAYGEEEFRTEARAVLGEYNKNAADPTNQLEESLRDRAYTTHPYKHTTMGFLRDIEDMPNQFDYSRTFFDRWYRPEYTTLLLAGDLTPDAALPLIERHWGGWKRGTHTAAIPPEGEPAGPLATHVSWETPTLPWVVVAFHAGAFDAASRRFAATHLLVDLTFGPTSELYRRLMETEQTVDRFEAAAPWTADPGLITIAARVKRIEDVAAVRDAVLRTAADAQRARIPAVRLARARAHERFRLLASFDSTESVGATLAGFTHYARTTATIDELFDARELVTGADLREAACAWFTDARLVVATLAHGTLPASASAVPRLPAPPVRPGRGAAPAILVQRGALPLVDLRLVFRAGSVHDPAGREGLAALAAALLADAGSRDYRIDEIREALHPLGATIDWQVDREMTAFVVRTPRATWRRALDLILPMLTSPGLRDEDFLRLREAQRAALLEDLRAANDEELAKERLQHNVFRGTSRAHPPVGTAAGLDAITLDDVRAFIAGHYTQRALLAGAAGDLPPALLTRVRSALGALPRGADSAGEVAASVAPPERSVGIRVEIIRKDTRATAISFGHPIAVTRAHPDFPALWLARAWLGEHRSSVSHLYQRIREVRGLNYGDYAYIEAFPGGMDQLFPSPNRARRRQLFEVWIRPVLPANAHMALRIALHELRALIAHGLDAAAFETMREYLRKSTPLLTATQGDRLGYALDAAWHGTPEFTPFLRDALERLSREQVNDAIRRHLSGTDLDVVIVTRDAEALRDALVADAPSTVSYDAPRPAALLEEDRAIGALRLGIAPDQVTISDVEHVFER